MNSGVPMTCPVRVTSHPLSTILANPKSATKGRLLESSKILLGLEPVFLRGLLRNLKMNSLFALSRFDDMADQSGLFRSVGGSKESIFGRCG